MRTKKAKRYDKELDREIEKSIQRFSEHLMSNSKWVKLIDKLVECNDKVEKIQFKKVQGDQIGVLYIEEDTTFGFDYWNNGFEGSNSLGGVLAFKEIEFLLFPKLVKTDSYKEQSLKEIVEIIESVGQFSLEVNDEMVKVNCYR